MQASIISPVSLLDAVSLRQKLHLVLVQELERSKAYADFYTNVIRPRGDYLILDNGAFELGEAASAELLLKWVRLLHPDEIVLPDVREDSFATLSRTTDFIQHVLPLIDYPIKCMAVPQGKNLQEWMMCLHIMLSIPQITCIGPYEESADWFPYGGRLSLLERIKSDVLGKVDVHLLGMDEDLVELRVGGPTVCSWVRSTDSSKPVCYGLGGVKLDAQYGPRGVKYPGRSKDFFECTVSPTQREAVLHNVDVLHGWLTDESRVKCVVL